MNLNQIKTYCIIRETYFINLDGDKHLYLGIENDHIVFENMVGSIIRYKIDQLSGWKVKGNHFLFD